MSSISCLVPQLTMMLDKTVPVFFSRPFLSQNFAQTLLLTLSLLLETRLLLLLGCVASCLLLQRLHSPTNSSSKRVLKRSEAKDD